MILEFCYVNQKCWLDNEVIYKSIGKKKVEALYGKLPDKDELFEKQKEKLCYQIELANLDEKAENKILEHIYQFANRKIDEVEILKIAEEKAAREAIKEAAMKAANEAGTELSEEEYEDGEDPEEEEYHDILPADCTSFIARFVHDTKSEASDYNYILFDNGTLNSAKMDIRRVIADLIQEYPKHVTDIWVRQSVNAINMEWHYSQLTQKKRANGFAFSARLVMRQTGKETKEISGLGVFESPFIEDEIDRKYATGLIPAFVINQFHTEEGADELCYMVMTPIDHMWSLKMGPDVANNPSMVSEEDEDIPMYFGSIRRYEMNGKTKSLVEWIGIFYYHTIAEDSFFVDGLRVKYGLRQVTSGQNRIVNEIMIGNISSLYFNGEVDERVFTKKLRGFELESDKEQFKLSSPFVATSENMKISPTRINDELFMPFFIGADAIDKDHIDFTDDYLSQINNERGMEFYKDFSGKILQTLRFPEKMYIYVSSKKSEAEEGSMGMGKKKLLCKKLTDEIRIRLQSVSESEIIYTLADNVPFYRLDADNDFGTWMRNDEGHLTVYNRVNKYELRLSNMYDFENMTLEFKNRKEIELYTTVAELYRAMKGKHQFDALKAQLEKLKGKLNIPDEMKWSNSPDDFTDIYWLSKRVEEREFPDALEDLFYGFNNSLAELKKLFADGRMDDLSISKKKIRDILYPGDAVPDSEIVDIVADALEKSRITKRIPNFVIMGEAGTGKSFLMKNLVSCFLGAPQNGALQYEYKSAADLKGAYVGQTSTRVFDMIKRVATYNKMSLRRIIFIDEAYSLMEDEFGREAIEMLLPLMSGDRMSMESPALGRAETPNYYDFVKEGTQVPPIWLAGYEQKMREMLSVNPGLYRRTIKIRLRTPTVTGLFDWLCKKAEKDYQQAVDIESKKIDLDDEKTEVVNYADVFRKYEKRIKKLFAWATLPDFSEYFANYAGVDDFYVSCIVRLRKCGESAYEEVLEDVIEEKRTEIKRQYKAVLQGKAEKNNNGEEYRFALETDIDTTFRDIAGMQENGEELMALQGMREILDMIIRSNEYRKLGITVPKGALMIGPPGTGKTLYARALAGELQRKFLTKDNMEKKIAYVPVIATELNSTRKIEALFQMAEDYDVCVIFIDEIDAIGRYRNMSGARPDLLIQLMKELDGFESRSNLFVLAATNDADVLDPALKRPGRFDRIIKVETMEKNGRRDLLQMYMRKLSDRIVEEQGESEEYSLAKILDIVAKETGFYSASKLRNLVNEAAILNQKCTAYPDNESYNQHRTYRGEDAENHKNQCFLEDVLEMIERFDVGEVNLAKREAEFDVGNNEFTCSSVSIHEVGHAMVALQLNLPIFEKITSVPRGDAGGYVRHDADEKIYTKKQCLNRIKMALGGRVAEEMFYGADNISFGASQDILTATRMAVSMVAAYGMSEDIGTIALLSRDYHYLEKKEIFMCSEAFREKVDKEVQKILKEQLEETRLILAPYKEVMLKLAKKVFDEESMSGESFRKAYEELK